MYVENERDSGDGLVLQNVTGTTSDLKLVYGAAHVIDTDDDTEYTRTIYIPELGEVGLTSCLNVDTSNTDSD